MHKDQAIIAAQAGAARTPYFGEPMVLTGDTWSQEHLREVAQGLGFRVTKLQPAYSKQPGYHSMFQVGDWWLHLLDADANRSELLLMLGAVTVGPSGTIGYTGG